MSRALKVIPHVHAWHRTWVCSHTDSTHILRCSLGAWLYSCETCHASGYPIPEGVKT
jgi:hypothetical protein